MHISSTPKSRSHSSLNNLKLEEMMQQSTESTDNPEAHAGTWRQCAMLGRRRATPGLNDTAPKNGGERERNWSDAERRGAATTA